MRNKNAETVVEEVVIPTSSGTIRGHLRTPMSGTMTGAVSVHPATAVPERLYTGFAEYLATEGFAALTYDYRGTGASGDPRSNRTLRMRDWMSVDVPAVAEWTEERFPDLPQLAVGHSIGGHALSLNYGSAGLAGFVTVASHAGVTAAIPQTAERLRVAAVLRVLGPAFARTIGYVPGRRLGLGEDMPGAAMLEWSRWSRTPGYFFDDPTMDAANRAASVRTDVLGIGFTDDPWATPEQIDLIANHLTNAQVKRRTIEPASVSATRIGHMGFFRRGLRDTLWPDVTDWLNERARTHV